MTAGNGRLEANDICSPRDALLAAAKAARLARDALESTPPDDDDYLSDYHLARAERAARTAHGLAAYAESVKGARF